MKRENPHSALVASLDAEGLALLSAALDERACREELGFGTFAGAAELFRSEPACPRCGSSPWRDGREPSGLRRWRCRSCGARLASLTGTVFEGSRAGLPTWARFTSESPGGGRRSRGGITKAGNKHLGRLLVEAA